MTVEHDFLGLNSQLRQEVNFTLRGKESSLLVRIRGLLEGATIFKYAEFDLDGVNRKMEVGYVIHSTFAFNLTTFQT